MSIFYRSLYKREQFYIKAPAPSLFPLMFNHQDRPLFLLMYVPHIMLINIYVNFFAFSFSRCCHCFSLSLSDFLNIRILYSLFTLDSIEFVISVLNVGMYLYLHIPLIFVCTLLLVCCYFLNDVCHLKARVDFLLFLLLLLVHLDSLFCVL